MSQMGNVDFIDPITQSARAGVQGVAANANSEADRALQRAQIAAQSAIAKAQIDAQKTMQHASLEAESIRQATAISAEQEAQQKQLDAQSAAQEKEANLRREIQLKEQEAAKTLFDEQKKWSTELHNAQLRQLDAGTAEAEKYQAEADAAEDNVRKTSEAIGAMEVRTQLAQGNLGQFLKKMGDDLGAAAAAHTNAYEMGKQAIMEPLTEEEQKTILNSSDGVLSRAMQPSDSPDPNRKALADKLQSVPGWLPGGVGLASKVLGSKLVADASRGVRSFMGGDPAYGKTAINDADTALNKIADVAGTRIATVAAKGANPEYVKKGVSILLQAAKAGAEAMASESYLPGGRFEGKDREVIQSQATKVIQESVENLRKQGVPDSAMIGMLDALKDVASSKGSELLRPSDAKGTGRGETKQMVRSFTPLKNAKTAVEAALRSRGDQLSRVDEQYGKSVSTAIASFATEAGGDVEQFKKKMAELKVPTDVAEKLLGSFSSRGEMPWQVQKILTDLKADKSLAEMKMKQAGEKAVVKGARAAAKAGVLTPSAMLGLTGTKEPDLLGVQ
jgi:hypothetical protein